MIDHRDIVDVVREIVPIVNRTEVATDVTIVPAYDTVARAVIGIGHYEGSGTSNLALRIRTAIRRNGTFLHHRNNRTLTICLTRLLRILKHFSINWMTYRNLRMCSNALIN